MILALDVSDIEKVRGLVTELGSIVDFFKVGKQLFTCHGPRVVALIHDLGGQVFLDLKFHDIPNTVASAIREALRMNVAIVDVHALGGKRMMSEAMKVVSASDHKALVFGVTVLTSMSQDDLDEIGMNRSVQDQVMALAKLAKASGLSGVVASPQEIRLIKEVCGDNFLVLTPGIRPAGVDIHDQKRMMTPAEAAKQGADFIVVGRPILKAHDRFAMAQKIQQDLDLK